MDRAPILEVPPRWIDGAVLLAATAVAVVSARPFAGSWNDSSRLATAECLVDYHTLAIDRSIFVQAFDAARGGDVDPYAPDELGLHAHGTLDKLFVGGHYYSDKPLVQAVLMAGVYQVWKWCGGEAARDRPDSFCYLMTLATSGLSYVVAVWCVYRLALRLGLGRDWALLLTTSFAVATVAPAYARHVNGHILLLAVAAAVFLMLTRLAAEAEAGAPSAGTLGGLGALAGLGYTTDLGVGPLLVLGLAPVVLTRTRYPGKLAVFLLALVPWLVLHHSLNYAVGGTFKPANAVPEYFDWPGSPFNAENLTGVWNHTPGHFVMYAAALLFGKRGFVGHNLPLFLIGPAVVVLVRRRSGLWREALFALVWSAGTWLLYAALSRNYSGPCCSIRWFVPLLAPAYFLLALLLKECPAYGKDFLVLSGWGAVLGVLMWWNGPWMQHLVPGFWPIQAAALLSWFAYRRRYRGQPLGSVMAAGSAALTGRAA